MKLLFEKGVRGRRGVRMPDKDVPACPQVPQALRRDRAAALPELSELDVIRHFTQLSQKTMGVDSHFYPLGSCTMKYNPKLGERLARLGGFTDLHPMLAHLPSGERYTQGALELIHNTERLLCEITGMSEFTMQPLAGAHGELTGIMIIAAYHRDRGRSKSKVLVPDSAHGTNPASASIAGYRVLSIPSNDQGVMDLQSLENALDSEVAAVMMTCPNTLGLFNVHIREICRAAHKVDALMYYDGANMNAILGRCRPADMGFDVVHLNLHKTFGTPHGGGGPGAGPVGVVEKLREYLPDPRIIRRLDGTFGLEEGRGRPIGKVAPFYGNFAVIVRAYAYMLALGKEGMLRVSEHAVLNANYIRHSLKEHYRLPFDRTCMHECVFSASRQAKKGVRALDIAKGLIDKGFHPPTIYFPTIVKEALMIEPTETESKETLDRFIEAMKELARKAEQEPESLRDLPLGSPVGRLDEVQAARKMDFCFQADYG